MKRFLRWDIYIQSPLPPQPSLVNKMSQSGIIYLLKVGSDEDWFGVCGWDGLVHHAVVLDELQAALRDQGRVLDKEH